MLRVVVVEEGAAHLVSHRYPAVVILHIDWEIVRALVVPRLHLVQFRGDYPMGDLRDSILTVQLIFLIGGS